MAKILKPVFRRPPDLPPSGGLTLNFFQHDKILSMYYCKKLEVYFQKHGQNSQKTFLTGEPPDLSPSGGLTLSVFLIKENITQMMKFAHTHTPNLGNIQKRLGVKTKICLGYCKVPKIR